MIQPIKQFRVTRLTISGFKGYADQKTFQFGGMKAALPTPSPLPSPA